MADLPSELLYQILADLVADYIDLAITGPPAIPLPGPSIPRSFSALLEHGDSHITPWQCAIRTHLINGQMSPGQRAAALKRFDAFLFWTVVEAFERLPENTITPLLTVNRSFNHVLSKVLNDSLGCREHPGERWAILKDIRREFRRTRSHHLPPFPIKIKWPTSTPLLSAYIRLCEAQLFVHDIRPRIFNPELYDNTIEEEVSKHLQGDLAKLIPQPVWSGRVAVRMYLARVRLLFVERVARLSRRVGESLVQTYEALSTPDDQTRQKAVDILRESLDAFDVVEQSASSFSPPEDCHISNHETFSVLPAHVIRLLDIVRLFDIMSERAPSLPPAPSRENSTNWTKEMEEVASWAEAKCMLWDKFLSNPDYDEMDWSHAVFT